MGVNSARRLRDHRCAVEAVGFGDAVGFVEAHGKGHTVAEVPC